MAGEVAEIALMTECPRVVDDLIERAKAGEAAAFDQIMIRYQRRVVSTAWRMLGSEDDAKDAAQEVFMRTYRYLKSFKQGQDFAGWLYRIVINVCRDAAKRRGRSRDFLSLQAVDAEVQAGPDDLESDAILAQQRELISRALAALSTKEREALVLRDIEGFSTEEVARILGSSATTVRSQICSGRAKIKQYKDRMLNRKRRG